MSDTKTDFYKRKRVKGFYLSCILFFLILAFTLAAAFYNMKLAAANEDLERTLTQRNDLIQTLQANENIASYSIYEKNAEVFEEIQKKSAVPLYISHLRKSLNRFDLVMWDARYRAPELEIEVASETNEEGYAFQKLLEFMEEYRNSEESLFELESVEELRWYDKMAFTLRFTLK